MNEWRHPASVGHLNQKFLFPTYAAAKAHCRRMQSKHRRDRRVFVPVPIGSMFGIGSRDQHLKHV